MSIAHIFSVVPFSEIDSHLLQSIRRAGAFRIRARNTEAEVDQHLGDARHADAANADKMNVLNATEHLFVVVSGQ